MRYSAHALFRPTATLFDSSSDPNSS
eukprot:SAG31_NODE_40952_length_278_cov_0.865922_1_plen_25_part_01